MPRRTLRRSPARLLARAACAALLAAQAACAMSTSPVTGRQRYYAYSWADEVRIGREADREIVEEMGVYDDPALTAYVERVGRQVLAHSHMRRPDALAEFRETEFTFRVLDSEVVNAFALPGGYVYVTRGLLAHTDNEAQLAVVLGHEVGHVAARHSSQQALKAGMGMVGVLGLSLLGEELFGAGEEVMAVGSIGFGLLNLRHSRDDERESDRLGVEYAARAGYHAAEGAGFFTVLRRMGQKEGGGLPAFFSTHPDPGEREGTVERMALEWRAQGHPSERVERDAFLSAIDGMTLGPDPRKGFVENGTFYHPEGRFLFRVPRGWEHEQDGRQAAFSREGEQAAVLFEVEGEAATASAAAQAFITENELENVYSRPYRRGGRPAVVLELEVEDDDGEPLRVQAHFVEVGGRVLSFLGFSDVDGAAGLERSLDGMLSSLAELRERRILETRPARLEVVAAPRTAPFRTFVAGTLPRGMTVEDLAILNHVEPDQVIPRGTRLKLPR